MAEVLGFLVDRLKGGRHRREIAISQSFGVSLDDGERRAQVVGDVGRHLAASLVNTRQLGAHLVERRSQLSQFVLGANGDLLLQVALG